jgi:hypothetical protein
MNCKRCPMCSRTDGALFGVWNTVRKEWLLGPAMTKESAEQAAVKWNGRANPGERFEAARCLEVGTETTQETSHEARTRPTVR